MDKDKLQEAINEAHRFIKAAVEAKAIMEGKPIDSYYDYTEKKMIPITRKVYGYGPANAAVRRASMDLTRSLAKLRKY